MNLRSIHRFCSSVLISLIASLWASPGVAFELPGAPKLPGSGNKAAAQSGPNAPDAFLQRAQTAEGLLKASLWSMSNALLSKDAIAELKAKQDKADQTTDPKEKAAQSQEVVKSEAAALNQTLGDASTKANIEKMDGERKKLLGASAYNFALGVLQEKALSSESSGLISGMASNPSMMSKLGTVKDAASSIANQLSIHASLAGKMPSVFSAVGVQVPASADEKPKSLVASEHE